MTCRELRLHFEDPLRADAEFSDEAEHLAHCAECTRFVEARGALGAGLRLIRMSVPQSSTALDSRVLANYRGQIAASPRAVRSISRRRGTVVMCWTAAAAALVFAGALAIHPTRSARNSTAKIESAHRPSGSQSVTPMKAANHVLQAKTLPSLKTTLPHWVRRQRPFPSQVTAQSPIAEDFRSLMYCDPLSCGGVMQLIRVQLPSSASAFEPAATSDNGMIYADVLVGPDGVARGIRVVH